MMDQNIFSYAKTDLQKSYIEAYEHFGSYKKAAEHLGTTEKAVSRGLERVRGYMKSGCKSNGQRSGTSTLYDAEGNVKLQWVKEKSVDPVSVRDEIFEAMLEDLPRISPSRKSNTPETDLLNQYTITDYHLGMLSWPGETGEEWNTELAEDMLMRWFDSAIQMSPNADECVFAQLGDFLHYDSMESVTPTGKNLLDSDSRYTKIVRSSIRVIRYVIERLREKYSTVHVLMAEGNHDMASSIWLREMLAAMYEKCTDVVIDTTVAPYYYKVWGDTAIFYHHGHKANFARLAEVLAGEFPKVYGNSEYRYAHVGHLHHDKVLESALMRVEQHRTLAARDAYAVRGGYLSKRDAKVITYHKKYGEVNRITLSPFMIES